MGHSLTTDVQRDVLAFIVDRERHSDVGCTVDDVADGLRIPRGRARDTITFLQGFGLIRPYGTGHLEATCWHPV